jgi:transposase
LSAIDRSALEAVVANRNSAQKHVWRAKIVLMTADGYGTAEIMRATGKAKTVIWRWQERFQDEGAAGLWRDKCRWLAGRDRDRRRPPSMSRWY